MQRRFSFRTAAIMFRQISRLPVGERVLKLQVRSALMCSLQLSPLTRASPTVTSSVLRRLLSSEARAHIQKAIDASPVVLFMKGTPDLPQCGFSRAVIQLLDLHGVPPEKMRTYNVLEDPELRSGIKEFSCVMLPKHKSVFRLTSLKRVANSSSIIR
jgi:glutaredoxin-related protein